MKDIRQAFRNLLLSDATISSLVAGERIFPVLMQQGEKRQSVVYNRIFELDDYHMQGSSGLQRLLMQVDVYAQTPGLANELAAAVYDQLAGFAGEAATTTPAESVIVRAIFHSAGADDYDADAELYRMRRDYVIWYAAS